MQRKDRKKTKKQKPRQPVNIKQQMRKMIGTCMIKRDPLNFKPIGTGISYQFIRRTTLINSFQATSGTFVTNNSNCSFTQVSGATPTDACVSLAFRLDDLPNYTEFTNLFDQYCITGVRVRVNPRAFSVNSGITASNAGPDYVYVVKDCSDTNIVSISQAREYSTAVEWTPNTQTNRRMTVKHSPRIAVGAYAGAFNGYGAPTMMWVDVVSPNVQHYGLKIVLPPGLSGGTSNIYDLEFTYAVACRMSQ